MDTQLGIQTKELSQQEEQRTTGNKKQKDESFDQGELTDIIKDPLAALDSEDPTKTENKPEKLDVWYESEAPKKEQDAIEASASEKVKPAVKAVRLGEKLGMPNIRAALLEDDPHALDQAQDRVRSFAEGGLEGDQASILGRFRTALLETVKTAKKGRSVSDASPTEIDELYNTVVATLEINQAMEEANLEIQGRLEFQESNAEELDQIESDMQNFGELEISSSDGQELLDEENLKIIPVVDEVDYYEADKEPEYELVKVEEIEELKEEKN